MRALVFSLACLASVGLGHEARAQDENCLNTEAALAAAPPSTADGQRQSSRNQSRASAPAQVWADANQAARQRPMRAGFNGARYIYAYAPGALYELYANPNFISTILLEEGESLVEIAAGDTSRWQVSQALSEGQNLARTLVLVKPQAIGLRTNIVLVTDRRNYLIEAVSQASQAYSAEIAWCYGAIESDDPSTNPGGFNFNYRVRTVRGQRPIWTPQLVFDDGRRTWIEFGEPTHAGELPPLFVIGTEGPELVNYRLQGRRYVVDRIFDRAELRLGVRAPIIVRIERSSTEAPRQSQHRGRGP